MKTQNQSEIQEAIARYESAQAEIWEHGDYYNIFDIIGKSSSELLHSAIIANLLDPHGSHGLGAESLRSFLSPLNHPTINFENVEVSREVSVSGANDDEWGRMDIVITSDKNLIIIENKIDADDQLQQLIRYKKYAENNSKDHLLLYLTKDGILPDKKSSGNMVAGKDYSVISYRTHILNWIKDCIGMVANKPFLHSTLIQYHNTVNRLVNPDQFDEYQKQFYTKVLNCKGVILPEVFTKILTLNMPGFEFFAIKWLTGELKALAAIHGLEVYFYAEDTFLSGKRYCGFYFKKKTWKKSISFEFTLAGWKNCYYGVHSPEPLPVELDKKMNGMTHKPNDHYCYGNRYTSCREWKRETFINGQILSSIRDAIEHILSELSSNQEKYSME